VTGFAALTLIALIMMKGSFTRNTIDVEPDDGGSPRDINVSDSARAD